MYSTRRRLLRVGATLPLADCVAPTAGAEFEGMYSRGFEASAFAPCDRDERWWVVNDAELVERYRATADEEYEPVYARVRGRLSDPGAYGHLGEYRRELAVVRVLEVRPRRPDDC